MTDVAKAAGVSQSTVSMVLNNMAGARLSATTRAKVMSVALELGYRLPRRAPIEPAPGVQRRNLIGYLVDEISTSPQPVISVDGARDAAWENDCVVAVAVTRGNVEQEAAAIAALVSHPALLGIVYSTIFTRECKVPEALQGVPTVLLNCHDESQKLHAVVPAEVAGGHAATERLIAAGHQRIGFINGEPWMEAAADRYKGYRRALATADIAFDPALVQEGDWMSGTGYECTLALMKLARPPTAIFAANDLMALGALEALRTLGRRVPDDVALIGYDDQEISRHTRPPLTTMLLPNYEMGRAAVEKLLAITAAAPAAAPRRQVLKIECPLVERESVQRR
ncbi:MAG: LacI family DNA-binding transcriptional regulator [Burkholderiales bacterium]|nr:LacI family DNA-binding transcriptional regulator [Burkholderiales bacterium]